MATSRSKRPKSRGSKDGGPEKPEEASRVPDAADPDPAGRLLHRLRAREPGSTPPGPAAAAFQPGARVKVLRGPFMGKSGVVQELDGRGGARVMLGLLSARIDVGDLVSAADGGRDKPTLSSSHRKPR